MPTGLSHEQIGDAALDMQKKGAVLQLVWEKGYQHLLAQLRLLERERRVLLTRGYAWASGETAVEWSEMDAYRVKVLSVIVPMIRSFLADSRRLVEYLKVAAWLDNQHLQGMPMELMQLQFRLQSEQQFAEKMVEIAARYREELDELRPLVAQRDAEISAEILEQYFPD